MSEISIQVENLSKRYRLGSGPAANRHDMLRDAIASGLRAPLARLRGQRNPADSSAEMSFWALRDVNFSVKAGEAIGIIGRNGAGKSTLLKILSRITEPTRGRAVINGRVASLLEVGTGFHPELTGRENVYLSGAILGMRRAEITQKFDAIVAFAEIEKFLDTPVKRYSSGMYVRLAFAVAAHLEPEILLVDEVLAVGDIGFQKKCLGKMSNVAGNGRTVVFISHNMAAVASLCDRAMLLDAGRIVYAGNVGTAIEQYLTRANEQGSRESVARQIANLPADPIFRLLDLYIGQEDSAGTVFAAEKPVQITIEYEVLQPVYGLRVGFDLKVAASGVVVFRSYHDENASSVQILRPGRYRSVAALPPNLLAGTTYLLDLAISIHYVRWLVFEQVNATFEIINAHGVNALYADPRPGVIMPLVEWKTSCASH